MADETPDPEVERIALAELRKGIYAMPGDPTGLEAKAAQIARAVLADLRERYILVPRDGADPTPWEPGTEATVEQWTWRLLTSAPDVRHRVIESTLTAAREGDTCRLKDHAGRLQEADARLRAAQEAAP